MFPTHPHVFLEHPQPHVLRVHAPIAPGIKIGVSLFCTCVIGIMLFADGITVGVFGRMIFIAIMGVVLALVLTSKGYETIFDLQRMVIQHRYGLFGSTQAKQITIDSQIKLEISPSSGFVSLYIGNIWPRPLFNFTMSYEGRPENRTAPVRISPRIWEIALHITEWLNQNGANAIMECDSSRPYIFK